MKHILLVALLFSVSAFSQTKWSELIKGKEYIVDREISLEKDEFKLVVPAQSNIKLIDAMSLPMIKVELLKFDIGSFCNDPQSVSDIKLVDIKQPSGLIVTIGADLSQDCVMEVFVETKDIYTNSIFKLNSKK